MNIPEIVSCQAEHLLADGRVSLLGSTRTVTPTMTHVELAGTGFLKYGVIAFIKLL